MPTDADPPPTAARCDAVPWGTTTVGRPFRLAGWCDRLAGLTSAFGRHQKLVYSPLVCRLAMRGRKALVVAHELAGIAPRLYQFLLDFARDNELTVTCAEGAIAPPRCLTPPGMDANGGGRLESRYDDPRHRD
ncbi:MAG: DUF3579 domain-containing protein [Casimicrobiaceae bacterium]